MPNFIITMKDLKVRRFDSMQRPGGSWQNKIRYEPGFVVITDEWGNETSIPSDQIQEIKTEQTRY